MTENSAQFASGAIQILNITPIPEIKGNSPFGRKTGFKKRVKVFYQQEEEYLSRNSVAQGAKNSVE